jgi:hypothetical protein
MGLGIAIAVNGSVDAELAEASRVEVEERMGETTTYRLHYAADIREGDLPLLADSRLDAGSELSILVPVEGRNECLVKGPVHGQRIHLEHGGAGSTLEVQGSDTTVVMDREARSAVWADLTDSDAVTSILQNYGYTPDVETTSAGHYEDKHSLVQRASDLQFVRRLARRNGFLFWVTSDATGNETAHFKRPPLEGTPAAEMVINLASPSIRHLDIEWDVERPTSIEALQLDLNTKEDLDGGVPGTPQELLGGRGLADVTGDTRSLHLTAPADDGGDLQARGEGALIEADWFIRATCETSLETLGRLVRAHSVVLVRGAGSRHSGRYFVAAVRHLIDKVAHRMEIELIRNAWE